MRKRSSPFTLALILLVGGVFGLYHLVRVPVDLIQASQLDNAGPCLSSQLSGCIQPIHATVMYPVYHSKRSHDLVLLVEAGRCECKSTA